MPDVADDIAQVIEQVMTQRDALESRLKSLLALVHQDAGQHTESRGIALSCLDAERKLRELHADNVAAKRVIDSYQRKTGWTL